MKKEKFGELELYTTTLENGLSIYVAPNHKVRGIYATFTTRYGGRIDEFVPIGKTKMHKIPHGIAHFLEHKMFEQEDGTNPMSVYSERGADSNAYTNYFQTTYLFSGCHFFPENLNLLLDYVQNPYLTDENVAKEKNIIVQEAKMYLDVPERRLGEETMKQVFLKDPIRYPVIGSVEEIKSITKEDLLLCYHTFYHPSNMIVIVTGNVDPEEVERIISENQKKKTFEEAKPIQIKEVKEPKWIKNKEIKIKMNIKIPKVSYNVKIDISSLKQSNYVIQKYFSILWDTHFGSRSLLLERLKKNNIVTGYLDGTVMIVGDILLFTVDGETEQPDGLLKEIEKEMKHLTVTEEELERMKKIGISSNISYTDNIYAVNNRILRELIQYHKIEKNPIEIIKGLNLKELEEILSKVSFKEHGTVMIEPKE